MSLNSWVMIKRMEAVGVIYKGVFFLAILGVFCVACGHKKKNEYSYKYGDVDKAVVQFIRNDTTVRMDRVKLINVDCNHEYKEAGFLFHDLELVLLEANANSLIGEVNKIIVHDSFVYLLDIHTAKSLFVFNVNTGKFVRRISSCGKSISEYVEPSDFTVVGQRVVILDNLSKKLLVFDTEGNYKTTTRLPYALQTIERTDVDSVFIGVAGDNRHIDEIDKYKILKFNLQGNILAKYLKTEYSMNYRELNNLKSASGYYWYHAPFSNDIVFLDSSVTEVKYKFHFSKRRIPDDFVKLCDEDYRNFMDKYRRSHSYVQGACYYTGRYIISAYTDEGLGGCLVVYDMILDKIVFNGLPTLDSKEGTLEDFIGMRLDGVSPLFTGESDQVYGTIPSERLVMFDSHEKVKDLCGLDAMKNNNNPILFRVNIKE